MQNLYRDALGRFRSPPKRRIALHPHPIPICSRECSIFEYCKRAENKIANLGKPCTARVRLPAYEPASLEGRYDLQIMARQEHDLRRAACEGVDV